MPDFGPEPSMPPLSDAAAEVQRLVDQDWSWQHIVLTRYPDAVRPEVTFAGYVPDDGRIKVLATCYAATDIAVDHGTDANGVVTAISAIPATEAEAIAAFICDEGHPSRPRAPLDAHVLGWIYDYLTEFLAPCYAANGIQNPAPPTREYFIANYPSQNWWPSPGSMPMGTAEDDAIQKACPSAK